MAKLNRRQIMLTTTTISVLLIIIIIIATVKLSGSDTENTNSTQQSLQATSDQEIESKLNNFIVTFELVTDQNPSPIPCIGAYVGNNSVVSSASCFRNIQRDDRSTLYAIIPNTTNKILVNREENHFDFVKKQETRADIIYLHVQNEINYLDPIKIENDTIFKLADYVRNNHRLYVIGIGDETGQMVRTLVKRDQIQIECHTQMFCLRINETNISGRGSFLVVWRRNEYRLLGLQQNYNGNGSTVQYIQIPFYANWIFHFMSSV